MKKSRRCEICGSVMKDVIYKSTVMCKGCGFIYSDVSITQDELNKYYATTDEYSGKPNVMDTFKNKNICKTLSGYDRKINILDIGVGNGQLLLMLKDMGFENLSGLDPNSDCVRNIKFSGIKGYLGNIFNNDIKKAFDMIILNHVMEHLINLDEAVKSIIQIMKYDGKVYIEFPNVCLYGKECVAPFSHIVDGHVNHFTFESLIKLFTSHGFDLIECGERTRTVSSYIIFKYKGYDKMIWWYIDKSEKLVSGVKTKVDKLVLSQEPIYIWGNGSNLKWLQENTKLSYCNVLDIIDSKCKIKITSNHRILITPVYLADDIKRQIKKMGLPNKTFTVWG